MVVGESTLETEVVVIGSGPGGYAAAFHAADLGLEVTMVAQESRPGGVCLHQGCIPSKTLLHVSQLIHDARSAQRMGVSFGEPKIDLATLRDWRDQVIGKLSDGLATLARRRDVQIIRARAAFAGSGMIRLQGADVRFIKYRHAILATGSTAVALQGVEFHPGGRVMDSGDALALPEVPERLLVVGGGYVGLELGTLYAALGSRVTMVELTERLLPGADPDLVQPLARRVAEVFDEVLLGTRVASLSEDTEGVEVTLTDGTGAMRGPQRFDRVLVAIGRRPNSGGLGLEETGVTLSPQGFAVVDAQQRTTDPRIYAVGDVAGGILLAHKAMREGKVAAECIAGQPSAFDARAVPAVVYTDPQVAWCGLTEEDAGRRGRAVQVARYPWAASGRAATLGVQEGLTKLIIDPLTEQVLGVGIVGREAGEMIAEGVLAVEMAALASDLALSIHPHPTLSETHSEAAEIFLGYATHVSLPRGA